MHFDQKFDQKFEYYSCITRTINNASQPSLLSTCQYLMELVNTWANFVISLIKRGNITDVQAQICLFLPKPDEPGHSRSSGLRNVQSVQMHRGPPTSGGTPI